MKLRFNIKLLTTSILTSISTAFFMINMNSSVSSQEIPDDPRPNRGFNLVYGNDDRGELNSRSYPWSAIGRLDIPGGGHCTATLVGVDLILTNAHCVENNSGKLIKGLRFRPNLINNKSE